MFDHYNEHFRIYSIHFLLALSELSITTCQLQDAHASNTGSLDTLAYYFQAGQNFDGSYVLLRAITL